MATAKTHTWTPATPLGFMNTELEEIWTAINAGSGSYVTLTGNQTISGYKTFSVPVYINAGTVYEAAGTPGGASKGVVLRRQDGTGRAAWYWNSRGTASPVFTEGSENAGRIFFSPSSGSPFIWSWADGSGKSANDAITWTDLMSLSNAGDLTILRKIADYAGASVQRHTSATTGSVTPNQNTGSHFKVGALTGNITIANPSNFLDDSPLHITILPHATTDYTITWGSQYKFAYGVKPGTATGGAGAIVCSCFYFDSTVTYCSCAEDYA